MQVASHFSIERRLRQLAPRGVLARLKLARLAAEQRLFRRKIDHREFRAALLRLGEWEARPVWVQSSLNDFYNVEMRPLEIIDMMLGLVGPRGTLMMPAFPLNPDPLKVLAIDSAATNTGLLTELFRRMPDARRSIHIYNSVSAVGPDAGHLTESHHHSLYPWGDETPYGRLVAANGLMVGLGIVTLGFTPLHKVECDLHHQVPVFEKVFPGETVTYAWRRRSGETGEHTFLRRHGRIWPGRLVGDLPPDVLRRFRLSNLSFQAAPAFDAVEALKVLALSNKTIYCGL